MKKVFISKNYRDRYTASSKAKIDCEEIIRRKGYVNIGLPISFIQNCFIGRVVTFLSILVSFIRMPQKSIVFLQYPVYGFKWQILRASRKNKVITIIHDLNILRGARFFSEKKYIELTDVLIVHTEAMKDWCTQNMNCRKIVVLGLFDYLAPHNQYITHRYNNIKTIAFAGNLAKSTFIDYLHYSKLQIDLFGVGVEARKLDPCCKYRGCFSPSELHKHIHSMFGLVWDGDSIHECTGVNGDYLKYISPHKTSLYLSCGIPVIVWKKSALANFIEKNNIGVSVDSLENIDQIIGNMSQDNYYTLQTNVRKIQYRILDGAFLDKALMLAEQYV